MAEWAKTPHHEAYKQMIEEVRQMSAIPDHMLNATQQRTSAAETEMKIRLWRERMERKYGLQR